MVIATFRFYEELNDFLASARRKRDFEWACPSDCTVKQAIEALGVPHAEVELILANGKSVDSCCAVQDGDRISVYPVFESLDITPVLKVRAKPLRCTRFIADARLGVLAKRLRALGFDTAHARGLTRAQIARIATEERRIVLTRDPGLLRHEAITHGCHVREATPRRQLQEIISRLDLYRAVKPFGRSPQRGSDGGRMGPRAGGPSTKWRRRAQRRGQPVNRP